MINSFLTISYRYKQTKSELEQEFCHVCHKTTATSAPSFDKFKIDESLQTLDEIWSR